LFSPKASDAAQTDIEKIAKTVGLFTARVIAGLVYRRNPNRHRGRIAISWSF
jgi:hypothetical protein